MKLGGCRGTYKIVLDFEGCNTGLLHYNGGMWSGQKVRYSEKSVIENNRTKYNSVVLLCSEAEIS